MDKPSTMGIREYITKKISQEQSIDHLTVKTVINDMFREANAALLDNNSVEIAGFGRFTFNVKKAGYRMIGYKKRIIELDKGIADVNTTEAKRKGMILKKKTTTQQIAHLEYKLYGTEETK